MTRAQRYANHAGGRKYHPTTGAALPRSTSPSSNPGAADKLASAAIFRAAWERAKACERYGEMRVSWEERKRVWERENPDEVERLKREREESRARKGTRGGKKVDAAAGEGEGKGKAGAKRGRAAKVKKDEDEHEEEQVKGEEGEEGEEDEAPAPPPRASKRRRVTRASAAADAAQEVKQE